MRKVCRMFANLDALRIRKDFPSSFPTLPRNLKGTSSIMGCPCGSAGKESTCNVRYLGSIPGLGRSPGEGKGYTLQYSGLENSMDYSPWGCKELYTTKRLSLHFL